MACTAQDVDLVGVDRVKKNDEFRAFPRHAVQARWSNLKLLRFSNPKKIHFVVHELDDNYTDWACVYYKQHHPMVHDCINIQHRDTNSPATIWPILGQCSHLLGMDMPTVSPSKQWHSSIKCNHRYKGVNPISHTIKMCDCGYYFVRMLNEVVLSTSCAIQRGKVSKFYPH